MKKILSYLAFGGMTAGIEFSVFLVLHLSLHIYVASTISFLAGLSASFIFNKFIVFRGSKAITKQEVVQFAILGVVNSQLSSLLTTIGAFIFPGFAAKMVSMLAIVVWNYIIMNKIIFKDTQA